MKPRRHLLAAALIVVSGCLYIGSPGDRAGVTTVHAADLTSSSPPLAAFALRVAATDLPLSPDEAALVAGLEHEIEPALRPIDDARVILVEVLVRAVDERRFRTDAAATAAARVVDATAEAAPQLEAAIVRLHDGLTPFERQLLMTRLEARIAAWSPSWRNVGTPGWTAALAAPTFTRGDEVARDARETARRWADGLVAEVGAKAEDRDLGDAERRDLIERLRTQ